MRAAARNTEFEAYMAARQAALLRTAYLLTGERRRAEDLVQGTLARLYLSWEQVNRHETADSYMRRVMVQEMGHRRLAWRRRPSGAGRLSSPQELTDLPGTGIRSETLWRFVQALPRSRRAVAVLLFYEGLSDAEAAEILGVSVESVRSRSRRVLAAMRGRAHTPQTVSAEGRL
jgi:RNA polymerase sigma factor (sigma-70 family)